MEKIVVATDSFKGSLSSKEAGDAIAAGVRRALPDADVVVVPVGDGGEGTVRALMNAVGATEVRCRVHGPLADAVDAVYAISTDGRTAIIEAAAAAGLTLIEPHRRNPMRTTTFGLGEMIADALRRGVRRFLVGLGGSATNDGGAGMLAALGYEFRDGSGNLLKMPCGADLLRVARIESKNVVTELAESTFIVACDVTNPLYGPRGAACVFGPQKGASEDDVEVLDYGLRKLADVMTASGYPDVASMPGAGAAGGLGAAFAGFLGARLKRGTDMVLETVNFDSILTGASLVITGEGRIDAQTAMGKTPAGIFAAASRHGIPVIAIGGTVDRSVTLPAFAAVIESKPSDMPLEEAMNPEVARRNLEEAAFNNFNSYL